MLFLEGEGNLRRKIIKDWGSICVYFRFRVFFVIFFYFEIVSLDLFNVLYEFDRNLSGEFFLRM